MTWTGPIKTVPELAGPDSPGAQAFDPTWPSAGATVAPQPNTVLLRSGAGAAEATEFGGGPGAPANVTGATGVNLTANGGAIRLHGGLSLVPLLLGDFDYTGSGNLGPLGPAASTVDAAIQIEIAQHTPGQTLLVPAPTDATTGKSCSLVNSGSVSVRAVADIAPGTYLPIVWSVGLGAWVAPASAAGGAPVHGSVTTDGTGGVTIDVGTVGIAGVAIVADPAGLSPGGVLQFTWTIAFAAPSYSLTVITYGDTSDFVQYTGYPIENGRLVGSATVRLQLAGYGNPTADALRVMVLAE